MANLLDRELWCCHKQTNKHMHIPMGNTGKREWGRLKLFYMAWLWGKLKRILCTKSHTLIRDKICSYVKQKKKKKMEACNSPALVVCSVFAWQTTDGGKNNNKHMTLSTIWLQKPNMHCVHASAWLWSLHLFFLRKWKRGLGFFFCWIFLFRILSWFNYVDLLLFYFYFFFSFFVWECSSALKNWKGFIF